MTTKAQQEHLAHAGLRGHGWRKMLTAREPEPAGTIRQKAEQWAETPHGQQWLDVQSREAGVELDKQEREELERVAIAALENSAIQHLQRPYRFRKNGSKLNALAAKMEHAANQYLHAVVPNRLYARLSNSPLKRNERQTQRAVNDWLHHRDFEEHVMDQNEGKFDEEIISALGNKVLELAKDYDKKKHGDVRQYWHSAVNRAVKEHYETKQ